MMQLLDAYFEARQKVFDYFGYNEDWRVIPLQDYTDTFWCIEDGTLYWADDEKTLLALPGDHYSAPIWTYRHLPKHVYEGEEFTMAVIDTQTDGNKFLAVLDNSKKREIPEDVERW